MKRHSSERLGPDLDETKPTSVCEQGVETSWESDENIPDSKGAIMDDQTVNSVFSFPRDVIQVIPKTQT